MLLSHQLPGWKLALHGFIFFFFLQRRDRKNNLESKNDSDSVQKLFYSGLITKKSLSGVGVFFCSCFLGNKLLLKEFFLLLSLKTYDSKDGIT